MGEARAAFLAASLIALLAGGMRQASAQSPADLPDLRKSAIESPVERLISGERSGPTVRLPAAAGNGQPAVRPARFKNPAVPAGLVAWHKDVKAASAAAQKSGKPVLLFQMLGNLDDEFC